MEFKAVNKILRIGTEGEVLPKPLMRMGAFSVRRYVIEKYPSIMFKIFEKFVPLEIENSFIRDSILYVGYSNEFEETPEGSMVKEYEVWFHQDLMGDIIVQFKLLEGEVPQLGTRRVTFF